MDFFDGLVGIFCGLKNDKCLAFGIDIFLRHNVDNVTEFGEDGPEGFGYIIELNFLLEIVDVDSMVKSVYTARRVGVQ